MKLTNREADGVTIVSFEGKLDTNTCPEAEVHLKGLLDQGVKKLLVDFKSLDFVSSAGLRILLASAKRLETSGGELRVCSLNEIVHEIFEISGFSVILNVCADEEEALKAF
jgi:anti-sigma B factor antagonist